MVSKRSFIYNRDIIIWFTSCRSIFISLRNNCYPPPIICCGCRYFAHLTHSLRSGRLSNYATHPSVIVLWKILTGFLGSRNLAVLSRRWNQQSLIVLCSALTSGTTAGSRNYFVGWRGVIFMRINFVVICCVLDGDAIETGSWVVRYFHLWLPRRTLSSSPCAVCRCMQTERSVAQGWAPCVITSGVSSC